MHTICVLEGKNWRMLVIHMRKSGGSSLEATLAAELKLAVVRPASLDDYSSLEIIAGDDRIISFVHLHPSYKALAFIKSLRVPVLVLLRDPEDAYRALRRHADAEGVGWRPNGALFFRNARKVASEFFYNWLSLRDVSHVKIVFYDCLYSNFSAEFSSLAAFLRPGWVGCKEFSPVNRRLTTRVRAFKSVDIARIPLRDPQFKYPPVFSWYGRVLFFFFKVYAWSKRNFMGMLSR